MLYWVRISDGKIYMKKYLYINTQVRRKSAREVESLNNTLGQLQEENDRLNKSKKKLQSEVGGVGGWCSRLL